MGAKINLIVIGILLLNINLFSQSVKLDLKNFNTAKNYTMCKCMQYLYQSYDSNGAYNFDYSTSYFLQNTKLSYLQMQKLDSILILNISDYLLIPSEQTPSNKKANMVSISCITFCNSSRFKKYFKNK